MRRLRLLARNVPAWLAVGLVLREAFSFWTGHPYDTEVWIRNAFYVSAGGTPYALMPPVPGLSYAYTDQSLPSVGYLPFWSLLVAGLYEVYGWLPGASRFVLYFWLKQPPILGDLALGYLLFRSVGRWGGTREQALQVLRFWLLFPYAIVVSAVWGQFDAIVMTAVVLAFLATRAEARGALFGLGIALKWFPVVVLPYVLFRESGWRKGVVVLALAIPALLTGLVIAFTRWDLVGLTATSAFAAHGGDGGMTITNMLENPAFSGVWKALPALYPALGFLWVPGCVVGGAVAQRRFPENTAAATVQGLVLVAGVFGLTRFAVYEQYLLYLFPWLLLDVVLWHPERRLFFRYLVILGFAFMLVNNDVLVRFLGPLSGSFVTTAYAADVTGWPSVARVLCVYVLNGLITLGFIQMVRLVLGRSADPRPWPVSLAVRLRALLAHVHGPAEASP